MPARNTIFLSLALGLAEASGARDIFIGVNALDYSGYPDCRPQFIAEFERLANLATKAGVEGERFTIHAPLLEHDQGRDRPGGGAAGARRRRSATAATIRSPMAPIAAAATPAGCARRASPKPDSRIRRPTHDLRRQGMLPHAPGGGRAVGQPRGLPALCRAAICGRGASRTGPAHSAASATPISSARTARGAASSPVPTRLRATSISLWGDGRERRLVVITGGEPMLQLDRELGRRAAWPRLPHCGRNQRNASGDAGHRLDLRQPEGRAPTSSSGAATN